MALVMSVQQTRFLILLGGPLALAGCSLFSWMAPEEPPRPANASESNSPDPKQIAKKPAALVPAKLLRLNHGYSLLYELMGKEGDVDKILILRDASAPTQEVIHQIATFCTTAKKQLDTFPERDPQLQLTLKDLPEAEVDTRAAIEWATTKKLLLGSGFELKLILTQVSATEYGAFLCQTLVDLDPDKERKVWLKDMAKGLLDLHHRIVDRLTVKP